MALILLLTLAGVFGALPFFASSSPVSHVFASGPTIVQKQHNECSAGVGGCNLSPQQIVVTFSNPTAIGNILIAGSSVACQNCGSGAMYQTPPTDSQGNTFTRRATVLACGTLRAGVPDCAESDIWTAPITGTTADAVTFKLVPADSGNDLFGFIFEASGVTTTGITNATNHGDDGKCCNTTIFTAQDVTVGVAGADFNGGANCGTYTFTTGFTANGGCLLTANQQGISESNSSGVAYGTTHLQISNCCLEPVNTIWSMAGISLPAVGGSYCCQVMVKFVAPTICGSCSGQNPLFYYTDHSGHPQTLTVTTSFQTIQVQNNTAFTDTNPFFWNTQLYIPSPASGTIQSNSSITITYTLQASINRCLATNDPLKNLYAGCWLDAVLLTYGNLIGVGWFMGILTMLIPGMLYLKHSNVGITILTFLVGVVLTSIIANNVTGANTLPGPIQILGEVFAVLAVIGIVYKLFAGGRG